MLFGVRSFVYLLAVFSKVPNKCFPLTLNSDVRDNFFFGPSESLISTRHSVSSSAFSLRPLRLVQPSNLRRALHASRRRVY